MVDTVHSYINVEKKFKMYIIVVRFINKLKMANEQYFTQDSE